MEDRSRKTPVCRRVGMYRTCQSQSLKYFDLTHSLATLRTYYLKSSRKNSVKKVDKWRFQRRFLSVTQMVSKTIK